MVDAMRRVLLGATPDGIVLSTRASRRLDELRDELGHRVDATRTVVLHDADGCRWWTWAGGRANAVLHAALDRTIIGRVELVCVTTRTDVLHEIGKARPFPCQIQILDGGLYDRFDLRIKHAGLVGTTAMLRDQRRCLRSLAVGGEESVHIRTPNPEG